MKAIIIKTKWLKRLTGIRGILIFPFIIYTPYKLSLPPYLVGRYNIEEMDKRVENHEMIHFNQALETWVVKFYVLYLYYYFKYRIQGLPHFGAYTKIPFEVEAYTNERNPEYLFYREKNAWKKYVV